MINAEQKRTVTVVVPAYNEAERITPALDELAAFLRSQADDRPADRAIEWDVLVVDDGSSDGTVAVVLAHAEAQPADGREPRLRVLERPHEGKGAAVRAGMLAATGDLVIFTYADLATPADQLPLLVAALEDHDVALGSRVQPDGSDRRASQPAYRRALGRFFHLLAALWVTGDVPDTQCGFKGFHREAAQDIFARQQILSIVFDAELIFLARRRGYSVTVVPVQWNDRRGSRMRIRPRVGLQVAWDLVRIPFLHARVARRGEADGERGP